MKTFTPILVCLALLSCTEPNVSVIPAECRPHVEEFFQLAAQHGLAITPEDLKIYYVHFGDLRQGNSTPSEHIVRIDTASLYWKTNPEALLFHELAHVYLHRGHDDAMIGMYPKSIMNSAAIPAYGTSYLVPFPAGSRDYYIQELFDRLTPTPNW